MTHDREELRLRFFEIAFADRLERRARGGVDSQLKAAKEAADLAATAVDAFFAGGPFAVRKEPDYPWYLAPEGTVGAATDADGAAFWWSGETYTATVGWVGLGHNVTLGYIPNFTLPGDWRESWRWMPGKEPAGGGGAP